MLKTLKLANSAFIHFCSHEYLHFSYLFLSPSWSAIPITPSHISSIFISSVFIIIYHRIELSGDYLICICLISGIGLNFELRYTEI